MTRPRRHGWLTAVWLVLGVLWLAAWPAQAQGQVVEYIHTDALGSVVAVTDQNRNVIERREYEPYGKQLTPAVEDGPGYTGHVQDAATGLVYMQQRYYDPELGRFLSVDPVTANPNIGVNFNRYWYANNNPYKFKDPDGREIVFALQNGATFADQAETMYYLASSSTAAGEIAQLHFSDATYTITFDRDADSMSYDHETRTVTVNPTSGLRIDSSGEIQTPALGAGHEISHAAQHDRVGTEAFDSSLDTTVRVEPRPGGGISVTPSVSSEEARATRVESQMAVELGEASRADYADTRGQVSTCGPTGTTKC